jgi:CheY-specific phosphatase CheX
VSAKFFGQFLLEQGAVTADQLLAAVKIQETTNVLLGTRAIDAGLMTAEQVEKINTMQRTIDRRFGELAIQEGMLTEEQLKELLSRQKEERLMLGEALIKTGAFDNAKLATQLAAFKKEAGGTLGTIAEIYDGVAGGPQLEIVTDVMVKMFLRLLHTSVRAGACHADRAKLTACDFTVHQRIKGDFNALVCLDLSTAMLKLMAGKLLGFEPTVVDGDTLDGAGEFVNIALGNVCARLSAGGRKVELDPPAVHSWRNGPFGFDANKRIVATPLLHPDETIELVVVV